MYIALDTTILVYAEGVNGKPMQQRARAIVDRLSEESTLLPVQALGELYAVLVGKAGRSRTKARDIVLDWSDTFPLIDTSSAVLLQAMELSVGHQLAFWDSVILAAAALMWLLLLPLTGLTSFCLLMLVGLLCFVPPEIFGRCQTIAKA